MKAESSGSAFCTIYSLSQNNFKTTNKTPEEKYNLAKKLFEEGADSQSLELAYSLLKIDDQVIIMKVNSLLGKIHQRNNNIDTALKHLKKSLYFLEDSLDEKGSQSGADYQVIKSENLRLLGKLYFLQEKKDSTVLYLNKLIEINSLDKEVLYNKANAYNILSVLNFNEKKYDKGKLFLDNAIEIFKTINNEQDLSMAYINLANYYEVDGEREKALKTYFKALPYIEHKNDPKSLEYKETLYYNIAWTMYNLKDYKAYNYLEKSYNLKDSILNVSLQRELKKIEQTHNIDLIRREEESKRFKLERNNWFIGIIGVSLSLLFLYIANLYKLKQKNLSLQLSQKELEQQKKLEKLRSESQSKIINAAMDAKEDERQLIAETLHDNVSAMLSSANMHLEASSKYFKGDPPIEFQKTKDIITETSEKIRDLSHTLVSSFLLKFGLEYAIKDKAEKYSNSNIRIHTAIANVGRYAQDFEVKIFNIIQELINNVLKHSNASSAFIAIEDEDDTLLIIVKDNGIGFQKKRKAVKGIGLRQIEARVEGMNGDFIVETSEEKGTKITIEVPVVKKKNIIHV